MTRPDSRPHDNDTVTTILCILGEQTWYISEKRKEVANDYFCETQIHNINVTPMAICSA